MQTLNQKNITQIKTMVNAMRNANNPGAMMQSLINSNPQMRGIMQLVNQYGGNPEKAFYSLAEQKGVDPEEVLSLLR